MGGSLSIRTRAMRLWHLLFGIAIAGLVFGFIRLMGLAALVTAAGIVMVLGVLGVLGSAKSVSRSVSHLERKARTRPSPARWVVLPSVRLLGLAYGLIALFSLLFLLLVLAIPLLILLADR